MSSPKITYWFGAGASYHAVPLQNNLAKKMRKFCHRIKNQYSTEPNSNRRNLIIDDDYNSENITKFTNTFLSCIDSAEQYGTIDILAKSLWAGGKVQKYKFLKSCVNTFFTYWRYFGYKTLLEDDFNYQKIDKRYASLISQFIDRGPEGVEVYEHINFLSYNYDLQLETVLGDLLLFENQPDKYTKLNNQFPFVSAKSNTANRITHLNGHCGFAVKDDQSYVNAFAAEDLTNELNFVKRLDKYLENKEFSQLSNFISYAWEEDDNALKNAIDILNKTDFLIIIGYSFPTFNRNTDLRLLDSISQRCQVTYIDRNPNSEVLESLLPIHKEKGSITYSDKLDQFSIPPKFFKRTRSNSVRIRVNN